MKALGLQDLSYIKETLKCLAEENANCEKLPPINVKRSSEGIDIKINNLLCLSAPGRGQSHDWEGAPGDFS
jgi:hypothetical protein